MLTSTKTNPDCRGIDEILPSFIDTNGSVMIMPDEEVLNKEFENFRVQKIFDQLPEYCTQLLFLS